MLQEDNYTTNQESIICLDCIKNPAQASARTLSKSDTTNNTHPTSTTTASFSPPLRSFSSPSLVPPDARPTLSGVSSPLHSSFSGLTGGGIGLRGSPGAGSPLHEFTQSHTDKPNYEEKTQTTDSDPDKLNFTELDPNEQFSSHFYKSSRFYRRLLGPSDGSTSQSAYAYGSAPSLSSYRGNSYNNSTETSPPETTEASQTKDISPAYSDTTSGNDPPSIVISSSNEGDTDESSMFSSDFYRKSYFYKKANSLNTLDMETPNTFPSSAPSSTNIPSSDSEGPTTLADKTIKRERRLSRKGRHSIEARPIEIRSSERESDTTDGKDTDTADSLFSESFYKKSYQKKKFDFDFKDFSAPSPSPSSSVPSFPSDPPSKDSDGKTIWYKALPEDPTSISETLLDTSEDMKGRGRLWTSSTHRKLPPSMGIRVAVPSPYVKKAEPVPAPSPSPPLSLPSSPSPSPPPIPSNSAHTPTSPKLPRKPQQGYGLSPNPPVLNFPASLLTRSASPPLSLPDVPTVKVILAFCLLKALTNS